MPQDVVRDALTSVISRVVAALSVPIAAVIAAVLYWLQDELGINLQVDPAVAASFVGTIILGAALTAFKWLEGRAAYESTVAAAAELQRTGAAAGGIDPPPPRHVPGP